MHGEAHFVDILEPRRTQSGIFRFMTRDWHPKKTQILAKNYTPQDLKDITACSLYLEMVIEAESAKTGFSKQKIKQEIMNYIEEIGLDKKMHVIRWLGMFAIKVAFNMNIAIYVNEPAIVKIKSSMGKNPVLFLPTHRSYADFCILTYLCYHYDIELPAVASGMDFYSMAVIGQVLRETCAFYIRRTLAGAPLYAATLRQYVRTLVAKHNAPIEFFLEGTRSRSNKSLPPKYGMLSMALAPLFAGEVPEVTIVPVSINYDRLMEQTTFAYEHLGVPKPKESTRGLLKWVSTLNDQFGNMYINFGEPMSVKEYLKHIPYTRESLKPVDLQELSPEQFSQVREVAEEVICRQQAATVLTAANLLAVILTHCLVKRTCISYEQLLEEVEWLKKVLTGLGGEVMCTGCSADVERVLSVHSRRWMLDERRLIRLHTDTYVQRKRRDNILNAETMRHALPVIELQLYVNPVLHYLVPSALVALLARRREPKNVISRHYRHLRKMLRHEFFHSEKYEAQGFDSAFEYCMEKGVVSRDGDAVVPGTEQEGGRMWILLRCAVWPALGSLIAAIRAITQQESCTHASALKLIQTEAARGVNGSPLPPTTTTAPLPIRIHPYSLSLSAAASCLRGLVAVGAITTTLRNETTTYNLVSKVMTECQTLVESILPDFDVDLSSNNPVFFERPKVQSRL